MRYLTSRLLLLLLPVLAFTACKEDGIYTTFYTNYEFEASIPPTSGISLPFSLLTTEQESNFESQYNVNDTRKDLVSEVELTSLNLQITDPPGEDFSFLNSATIAIDSDNQPEAQVAEKDPVPDNAGQQLDMDCFSTNLAPYIKDDAFTIRLSAVTDETVSQEITVKGTARFRVRAKVIGK